MSQNPLLAQLKALATEKGSLTFDDFTKFVTDAMRVDDNYFDFDGDVINRNYKTTLFYSGAMGPDAGNVYTGEIARDIADRSGGDVRILDNSKVGRLLVSLSGGGELGNLPLSGSLSEFKAFVDEAFKPASIKFTQLTEGDIVTVIGRTANPNGVHAVSEIPEILKSTKITRINGEAFAHAVGDLDAVAGLSEEARRAYHLSRFQNDFASKVFNDGAQLHWDTGSNGFTTRATVSFSRNSLDRLGFGHLSPAPTGFQHTLDADRLRREWAYIRAKGAANKSLILRHPTSALPDHIGYNAETPDNIARNKLAADELDNLAKRGVPDLNTPDTSITALWRRMLAAAQELGDIDLGDAIVSKLARWQKSLIDAFPNFLDNLPDNLTRVGRGILQQYRNAWDDTAGLFRYSGSASRYAARLTGAAAGIFLGVLDGVAEYKKAGGFTADFFKWAGTTALISAIAIPVVGAAAGAAMAAAPFWGTAAVITVAVGGVYFGVRSVAQNLVEAYGDEPDSFLYKSAKTVLDYMTAFEGRAASMLRTAVGFMATSDQGQALAAGVDQVQIDRLESAGAKAAAHSNNDENVWLYGEHDAVIIGGDKNDWLFHSGYGVVLGDKGNDVLVGILPKELKSGQKIGPAPAAGEPDLREEAEDDLKLILDGGEGNDWVISALGKKAITVGGLGRDWIFNTSQGGELYGDYYGGLSPDGTPAPDTSENSDNFWFWADTTIMDAQHFDVLKYFGIPLTGGDANGGIAGHAIMGLFGSAIGMANVARYITGQAEDWTGEVYVDHIQPWMLYAFERDEDGNLDMYISNAFEQIFRGMMAAIGLEAGTTHESIHKGRMKIENVDVVGSRLGILQRDLTKDVLEGRGQGDLSMVFRAVNPLQALLPVIKLVPGAIGMALSAANDNGYGDARAA